MFNVFMIGGNNEPVLIETAKDLEAAMKRVMALRESSPGSYLIVSQITGKKILFTANGGIQRS
jgi:hypothetical protein